MNNESTSDQAECMCSDLSTTEYSTTYASFNLVVIIVALPLMSVAGLIGNGFNVLVYSAPR